MNVSRRQMLQSAACGFGSLALAGMCAEQAAAETPSLATRPGHHPARAKRMIFIFMQGGPSQVDSFDPKPLLDKEDGKKVEFKVARTMKVSPERVFKSPWSFHQYGESGRWVSDLFPHIAKSVDDFCLIRSMHTEGVAHGPATLFLHTGATNLVRPSTGAWITYGLGTENQNLPGFVTINPTAAKGGPRNYSNAFLPTIYQGVDIGRAGVSTKQANIRHIQNELLNKAEEQRRFGLLQGINRAQLENVGGGDELAATIDSFELAFRMQNNAPGVIDLSQETPATLEQYGIGEQATDDFGRQCLMARRMAESGVRYVQINYSDNGPTPRWDQHSNIGAHETHALATDKPVAGLMQDLKQRGLLEDTLVWWGGEFGRTPFAQGKDGRDHNPNGFSVWLAGGGVKPGFAYGETDEYGYNAVVDKVHMHDLHATLLHLMGLDHERLTYRYAGRDFRLTDVAGRVVKEIFA
ncbi:DUF1501 domain-containing protein [Lignipirellula cremea]|uniref:Sulfatase n=1 Tax=Lignipirellula cremea TaxID=2528010 RepID=A0A518E166_9BACT|nr:DUF1501 domain-containing protein [Lignipirellula cremea]QDU97839.1 hypothetical protein Pla8534_56960 [Lignipirellula cremea]